MKFIIGRKLEMTQRYRPNGEVVPVTLVKVEPCVVTQLRTVDLDGYSAVQIGTGSKVGLAKPQAGHLKAAKEANPSAPIADGLATLREFRLDALDGLAVGAICDADSFIGGDVISVTGISKGKGFQGVVKRHHFAGGPGSHGQKDNLRMPGSIGGGGRNGKGRVVKGMRMAGRMGGDRVTVKNLEIVEVMSDRGLLAIKGAVPGPRGSTLLITAPGEMKFVQTMAPAEAPATTETVAA